MGGWFEIVPVVRGDPLVEHPDVAPNRYTCPEGFTLQSEVVNDYKFGVSFAVIISR